jgi:phosphoglycolate phosphatase-like HAD superfamily hydrolase
LILDVVGTLFLLSPGRSKITDDVFSGITNSTPTEIILRRLKLAKGAEVTLRRLRGQGVKLYMTSNLSATVMMNLAKSLKVADIFEGAFGNESVDVQKGNKFVNILKSLDINPTETIFVTDRTNYKSSTDLEGINVILLMNNFAESKKSIEEGNRMAIASILELSDAIQLINQRCLTS